MAEKARQPTSFWLLPAIRVQGSHQILAAPNRRRTLGGMSSTLAVQAPIARICSGSLRHACRPVTARQGTSVKLASHTHTYPYTHTYIVICHPLLAVVWGQQPAACNSLILRAVSACGMKACVIMPSASAFLSLPVRNAGGELQ